MQRVWIRFDRKQRFFEVVANDWGNDAGSLMEKMKGASAIIKLLRLNECEIRITTDAPPRSAVDSSRGE